MILTAVRHDKDDAPADDIARLIAARVPELSPRRWANA